MAVRNLRLQIEYDGTRFHGWQRQPGQRTVQGVLEDAVRAVFAVSADVIGAGRTDTGVHALDYPCNVAVDTALSTERIAAALTAHLPDDVVIHTVADAPDDFHARFDAVSRRYAYHMSTQPTALWRHVYHTPRFVLDAEAMARAAVYLRGEHDFTSFTPSANEANPVCSVIEAVVDAEAPFITFTVEADRFLHHMVRVMAGTLIDVGRGRYAPELVETIVRKRDRRQAGPTAPAHGLALVAVRYPGDPGVG
jgi:tRNA pseudouridine38-40 synthase